MKLMKISKLAVSLFLPLILISCNVPVPVRETMVKLNLAEPEAPAELVIAVPVPRDYAEANTGFLNGVMFAEEDIAAMGLSIPLRVRIDDDEGKFMTAMELAEGYVADRAVIGVVGHWYSDICSAVANAYRSGEKVLVIPTVSLTSLFATVSDYVFRNIPDDAQIAYKMGDRAKRFSARSAVIYYEDSTYGFNMSADLERYLNEIGINAIDRVCAPGVNELKELYKNWKVLGFDTVFMVSNAAEGTEFIKEMTGLGFGGKYICADGMDSEAVFRNLRSLNADITICSLFDSSMASETILAFEKRYEEAFGNRPDVWALQGYDSVMIIANAVKNGGVTTSAELSEYFRTAPDLGSLYGKTSFDANREISGKTIYYKTIG